MDWQTETSYRARLASLDNYMPSQPGEEIDDDKAEKFRTWLLRRPGLSFSRRIATFENYTFEEGGRSTRWLCRKAETQWRATPGSGSAS